MASVTKDFVLAGKAIFTLEIPDEFRNTYGNAHQVEVKPHYTFKVGYKAASGQYKEAYFLSLLTGPDNTKDYTYLGMLDKNTGKLTLTAKSCRTGDDVETILVRRVLSRLWVNQLADVEKSGFKLHHEGRCGRCGRVLTTPLSVERGIGPECWAELGWADEPKAVPKCQAPQETEDQRKQRIEKEIDRILEQKQDEAIAQALAESERLSQETENNQKKRVVHDAKDDPLLKPSDYHKVYGPAEKKEESPLPARIESFVQVRLQGVTKNQLEQTAQQLGVRIKYINAKRNGRGFILYGWFPKKMAH